MKHSLYKKIYGATSIFIQKRPFLKSALKILDIALTVLFFVAYGALCLYAFYTKMNANALMGILFPLFLCLLIVTVLRLAVNRPRPYAEDGANITPIAKKKNSENNSFPSRHVACAMAISTVFLSIAPTIALPLYFFACLLACIRFLLGLHYPTDLLAGGAIGLVSGVIVMIL
jgi:membrane-associated phospholipid phosphatase